MEPSPLNPIPVAPPTPPTPPQPPRPPQSIPVPPPKPPAPTPPTTSTPPAPPKAPTVPMPPQNNFSRTETPAVPVPPRPSRRPAVEVPMYNQTLAQKMGKVEGERPQDEIVGFNKPKHVYDQSIAPAIPKPNSNIRTFQSDSAQTIQTKQTSLAHIVIAEHSKDDKKGNAVIGSSEPTDHSGAKKAITLILSLILIAAGIYGGLYLYRKSIANLNPVAIIEEDEFLGKILEPKKQLILLAGVNTKGNLNTLINEMQPMDLGFGEIAEIVVTKDQSDPNAGKVSISEFFASVGSKAPSTLVRVLTPDYLIGVYKNEHKVPFIILRNDNFQNSYAGLLLWERDMYDDISWFIRPRKASSTELISFTNTNPFSDDLIKNKDTRVLRDDNGIQLISYAFADQNTIVISSDTSTLADILTILEKQAFIRRK